MITRPPTMADAHPCGPAASERVARDELCVWKVALDGSGLRIAHARSLLSADERDRASQYRSTHRRRMFIVTRAALRVILGQETGIAPHALRFAYGAYGKPSLEGHDCEVRFNVSHSGSLALVAVGRGREVGVDVEHVRPVSDAMGIARRFLAPPEAALVANQSCDDRDRTFLTLWARKEAVLKVGGRGLLVDPASFDVTAPPEAQLVRDPAGVDGALPAIRFSDVPLGKEHVAAIASERHDFSLVVREYCLHDMGR